MASETVTPGHFKRTFCECSEHEQWRRGGFSADSTHVLIDYNDATFNIHYGRMPLLVALFEFLSAMESWTFFSEFNDILKEMLTDRVGVGQIKAASNRVASRFRKYRHTHIDWSKHEERFDKLSTFLNEHSVNGQWSISDADIFTFWLLHSTGQEFRGYKTVFDAFVVLLGVIQKGQVSSSVQSAHVLGSDKDQGEIDPSNAEIPEESIVEWENPLPFFDQDELKNIKFLKGTSERQPIENLMKYGPYARRLPQAFLRLECFSPIQSAITNDLQMKRGTDRINKRISCDAAISYDMKVQVYEDIAGHLRSLQLAVWHVVSDSEKATEHDEVLQHDARMAFEGLRRKGFETPNVDEDRRSEFSLAGEEIVKMSDQIKRFKETAEALKLVSAEVFASDKEKFSCQLHKIYGAIDE